MIEKGTIVILSNTHWHSSWQTGNSVAAGLAERGWKVLFVEPIPKRWPKITEISRVIGRLTSNSHKAGFARQEVPPGVQLITPFSVPDVGAIGHAVNRHFFMPRLRGTITRQAVKSKPVVLIHTLPVHAAVSLQEALEPDASIYRCVYDWPNDPYSNRQLAEEELLAKVDMVWADCESNLERVSAIQPNAKLMLPAVDLALFRSVDYVSSGADKPVCGYFGSIGVSVDQTLLHKVSQRYKLRLVGPILNRQKSFPDTVDILGPVPREEVPNLIRDVDVLLLPYANHSHMRGVIPAKFFECLATGKPIVATNLTTVDPYLDLIYLCSSHEEVLSTIASVVDNEDDALPARRIACAFENSWTSRLDHMEYEIQNILQGKLR